MKLFNRPSNTSKGFTLIELLIVIALIGALAVGLLAALDPIEQVNRGRDSNAQSMATEYLKAQERNFARTQGLYTGTDIVAATVFFGNDAAAGISALVTNGELKSQFSTQAQQAGGTGTRVYILSKDEDPQSLVLSYQVYSKAFKTNPQLNTCQTNTTVNPCVAPNTCTAASATCYVRVNL